MWILRVHNIYIGTIIQTFHLKVCKLKSLEVELFLVKVFIFEKVSRGEAKRERWSKERTFDANLDLQKGIRNIGKGKHVEKYTKFSFENRYMAVSS